MSRRRLLLVHHFPLWRISGVTVMMSELLRLVPRVAPDVDVEYVSLDELRTPGRVAEVMRTAYGDASCVCGVNLHIERSWELTRALAEWGRDSSIRFLLYAHDYWPHHREAVRWLTDAAGWSLLASTEHVRRALGADGFEAALAEVGVPLGHIEASARQPEARDPLPLIASAGRLVPRKRFIDLVKAFSDRRLYENARLFLRLIPSLVYSAAQDRERLTELETAAVQGGMPLGSFVIDRNPMAVYDYSGYAAYVTTSSYEGFGMTPIEAAWSGCPPILSDIPPHRETAGHLFGADAEAFLYPMGDPRALRRLLNDEVRSGRRRGWLSDRLPDIRASVKRRWPLEATAKRLAELA
jgi:glycosyltransferase involved in cell wall biosynthesis